MTSFRHNDVIGDVTERGVEPTELATAGPSVKDSLTQTATYRILKKYDPSPPQDP